MAGDDEGGLKLTYRTIPSLTNNQISEKHTLSHNRLAPARKASTGARDRSRAIPSPQFVSPCLSYTLYRFFLAAWSRFLSSLSARLRVML
ncbi:hypothetical protein N7463_001351 [Penicillium fimorum]|uniref:Uncharacterized protein n=1 Tax=Penicillium fimorum TaxID=1882269 RepID=A0A9W9Y8G5_9EURO|nr:hypothetical protein N7463_001351 [Penicillium fimorum]